MVGAVHSPSSSSSQSSGFLSSGSGIYSLSSQPSGFLASGSLIPSTSHLSLSTTPQSSLSQASTAAAFLAFLENPSQKKKPQPSLKQFLSLLQQCHTSVSTQLHLLQLTSFVHEQQPTLRQKHFPLTSSLYFMPMYAAGSSPSLLTNNSGAGLTTESSDGPCAIAMDILVPLLFTIAR
uniref:Uncharacterized protein n=1 Tax=Salix viminalis TaxID=40686 RepID=A0A6N2LNI4_SALVM